jgi:hypothetical protein
VPQISIRQLEARWMPFSRSMQSNGSLEPVFLPKT